MLYEIYWEGSLEVNSSVHSLLGIVLGLFLVFRTNTAYDKWWEGRKIWGALVNDCRNLALKLDAFLALEEKALRRRMCDLITNYPKVLKEHLRDNKVGKSLVDRQNQLTDIAKWDHQPNYIASKIYQEITSMFNSGKINGEQLFLLDKEIKGLTDHLGACERIKNTPIPYAYNMYMKKFIFLYSLTLPLGFINDFGYWTIPVTLFIFYFLVTIEFIAEEIEEPFGLDENDLPTDELSDKINDSVVEILLSRVNRPS